MTHRMQPHQIVWRTTAIATAWLLATAVSTWAATPLGTAFTYQGRLKLSGAPLNGTADFTFTLWDAAGSGSPPSGGTQIGGAFPAGNIAVSDGLFIVELDFGPGAFNSDARWLQIDVRSPAGRGSYTTLSPRQPVMASPYALYALGGPNSSGDTHWDANGSNIHNTNSGNVGIGTSDPQALLDVGGGYTPTVGSSVGRFAGTLAAQGTIVSDEGTLLSRSAAAQGTASVILDASADVGGNLWYLLSHATSNPFLASGGTFTIYGPPGHAMTINSSGHVGIGELNPAHPLHVTAQIQTAAGRFVNVNTAGISAGVQAETSSSLGRAVYGMANVGSATAVYGGTSSSSGTALFGSASSPTGTAFGVRTSVTSPDGYAGYFVGGRNYFGGNVGLGAVNPEARLDVRGTVMSQNASGNNDNFVFKKSGVPALSNVKFSLSHRSNGTEAWMYTSDGSTFRNLQGWDHANNRVRFPANGSSLVVDMGNGRVGIGTATPENEFHAVGTGSVDVPAVVFGHNTSTTDSRYGGMFRTNSNVGAALFGWATSTSGAPSGVQGTSVAAFGRGVSGVASGTSGTNYGVRGQTNSPDGYAGYFLGGRNYFEGNVGIGTTEPQAALHVNGTTRTSVITITGGSDLAESFEVRSRDAETAVEPGMVVVIDPDHPGQLMLSTQAYDKRVAGIISGAGGLSPGMVMRAEGDALADGGHQVALTGRVWCWCDAAESQIDPGDMLTASDTPGHAMKVEPGADAHGAVLGKAMTRLATGEKGLVLVLVTLQ